MELYRVIHIYLACHRSTLLARPEFNANSRYAIRGRGDWRRPEKARKDTETVERSAIERRIDSFCRTTRAFSRRGTSKRVKTRILVFSPERSRPMQV